MTPDHTPSSPTVGAETTEMVETMFVICRACGGEGIWDVQIPGGWDEPRYVSEACSTCGGSGQCEEAPEPRTYADLVDEDASALSNGEHSRGGD